MLRIKMNEQNLNIYITLSNCRYHVIYVMHGTAISSRNTFDPMCLGSSSHAAIKSVFTYSKTGECNPHCLDFSKIPTTVSQKYTV